MRPGRIATLVAAPPLTAMAAFAVAAYVSHDHNQSVFPLEVQAWRAQEGLRSWAADHGDVLPASGPEVDALLARARVTDAESCVGPLRYERHEGGKRARLFALGEDGRPGGSGRDADLVWWIDLGADSGG